MPFELVPHPDFPHDPALSIQVEMERSSGSLRLWYWLGDPNETMRSPERRSGGRTDELWKHTCFEAFVQVGADPGYAELNFSPWGEWAAYRFDGTRNGMRDLIAATDPPLWAGDKGLRENGQFGWSYETADLFDPSGDWHLNLCTVLEAKDGTKSYWALAHAPGPPDFHNPATFIATLPPPR